MYKADVLGTGRYGTVYSASYLGGNVAVKAMFESAIDRLPAYAAKLLRNEAMIMCSLNHPNVVRILGAVTQKGWLVMELCAGGPLDTYLHDPDNVLDAMEKARLAAETATGMAYLHMREVDIIHGDMKAGNVLLASDKSVRICDFGMAEAKNRSKTMTSAAAASNGRSSVAITVAWSAPELFKGNEKSSESDVYALGMTVWQIYERLQPFSSMPEAAIVSQVLGGERPKYNHTPPSVKKIISSCWAKDPKDRPPSDQNACALSHIYEMLSRSQKATSTELGPLDADSIRVQEVEDEKAIEVLTLPMPTTQVPHEDNAANVIMVPVTESSRFCVICGAAQIEGTKFCASLWLTLLRGKYQQHFSKV